VIAIRYVLAPITMCNEVPGGAIEPVLGSTTRAFSQSLIVEAEVACRSSVVVSQSRQLTAWNGCPRATYKLVPLFLLLLRAAVSPLLRPAGAAFDVRTPPWQVFYTVSQVSLMIDSVWNIYLMF
jgi:hypothetical protein